VAKLELKNSHCVPGSLYVDTSCIDCGTCFHIAPQIFKEDEYSKSFNAKQPENLVEWIQAKEAVLSCPTNSIGVVNPPADFRNAPVDLPRLITENIYYCGYTSENSFGATTYLICHPEGNILVDSPRYNSHLVKQIEALGGIKYMFLTHKDDIADHQKYAEHFHCQRIIHVNDKTESTEHCEIILHNSEDFILLNDVKVIMTPGHTRGHMVLLYRNKFLFTGDHLFYDQNKDQLYASKSVNWHSWNEQVDSLHKLTKFEFEWVMPGHGGWVHKDPHLIKEILNSIH
jgi:ferredoxin